MDWINFSTKIIIHLQNLNSFLNYTYTYLNLTKQKANNFFFILAIDD